MKLFKKALLHLTALHLGVKMDKIIDEPRGRYILTHINELYQQVEMNKINCQCLNI